MNITMPENLTKIKKDIIIEEAKNFKIDNFKVVSHEFEVREDMADAHGKKRRIRIKKGIKHFTNKKFREVVRHELWHMKTWDSCVDTEEIAELAETKKLENNIYLFKMFTKMKELIKWKTWKESFGKLASRTPLNLGKCSIRLKTSSKKQHSS